MAGSQELLAELWRHEQERRDAAQRSLVGFANYTLPGYSAQWFHDDIAEAVERVITGESKRLMIFMPPGHGKSELASVRLPGYAFGRNPQERIMLCSYNMDLAKTMSRNAQRVLDEDEYRLVFPHVGLSGKNIRTMAGRPLRNVDEWEIVDPATGRRTGGYYRCAGVSTSITGRRFTLGIIDDPVKDRADADSDVYRERTWQWYTAVFYTRRLNDDARIIVIQTRWHEDDLSGRLLEHAKKTGEEWDIVEYPALGEDDAPLWPERFPLADLEETRRLIGTRNWEALFQQQPRPEGGAIWQRAWFRYYGREPTQPAHLKVEDGHHDQWSLWRFMTVDLAISKEDTADYTVCAVWGLDEKSERLFLLDIVRDRLSAPETRRTIRSLYERYRLHEIQVESVAYQLSMVQELQESGIPCQEIALAGLERGIGGKIPRAHAATPFAERASLWLDRDHVETPVVENELLAFPVGAYKDIPDAVAYACIIADQRCRRSPEPPPVITYTGPGSRRPSG